MAMQAAPAARPETAEAKDDLDDDRLGATVFHDDFVELAAKTYHTLHEKHTSNINFEDTSSDMGDVRTVEDAFVLFGLSPDDRTSRREQVKMWKHIESAMRKEIRELTGSGRVECYDRAKALNAALETIRAGFAGLQTTEIERTQDAERGRFETARRKLGRRNHDEERGRLRHQSEEFRSLQNDLVSTQVIERENLEHEILIAAAPPCRHSKRVLELRRAESGLSRLHRYDEAKNVRRMLDKIEGPEIKAHERLQQMRTDALHEKLKNDQLSQGKRMHERLGELKWASQRRAQRFADKERQRVKNLDVDMSQANALDRYRKPELVIHPSALLQKRPGHEATSSTRNGRKLLDSILGKKKDEAVYVSPLCSDHVFERPLSGTHHYDVTSSHYIP